MLYLLITIHVIYVNAINTVKSIFLFFSFFVHIIKNVKYKIRDLKDAMKINIASEEAAIRGYRQLMRYTNNMYLRRIYERIILDETTHWQIFDDILKSM